MDEELTSRKEGAEEATLPAPIADNAVDLAQLIVSNLLIDCLETKVGFLEEVRYAFLNLNRDKVFNDSDITDPYSARSPLILARYFSSDFHIGEDAQEIRTPIDMAMFYRKDSAQTVYMRLWDAINNKDRFPDKVGFCSLGFLSSDDKQIIKDFAEKPNSTIRSNFDMFFEEQEREAQWVEDYIEWENSDGSLSEDEYIKIEYFHFPQFKEALDYMYAVSSKNEDQAIKILEEIEDEFHKAELLALTGHFILTHKNSFPGLIGILRSEMAKNHLSLHPLLTQLEQGPASS